MIEIGDNRNHSTCAICRTEDATTDNVVAVRFGRDDGGSNGGQVVNLCPAHRREAAKLLMGDELRAEFLAWRGVDDPCLVCRGDGQHWYGSTATWRGGMGGAAMTKDVCDTCWGTGDRYRTGVDLRRLRDEESARVSAAAVDHLARSAGATLTSTRVEVNELVTILRSHAEPPKGRTKARRGSIWFAPLAKALADTLERAMRAR